MMKNWANWMSFRSTKVAEASIKDSAWIKNTSVAPSFADGVLLDQPFGSSRGGRRWPSVISALAALFLSGPVNTVASANTALLRTPVRVPGVVGTAGVDPSAPLEQWLRVQGDASLNKMIANISPGGAARGAVVASPSKYDPDYFYHWVRDAALVMDVIVTRRANVSGAEKARMTQMMEEYVDFSRANQLTWTQTGLGEPKFYADGRAFNDPWGRPQNDSPALRAVTLARFAWQLFSEGRGGYVENKIYRGGLPAETVAKADLEFVAHHWRETSYDLWEEVRGQHFYTRIVQLAAMREGAALAQRMNDPAAAQFYLLQAGEMEKNLRSFWSESEGIFRVTYNRDGGLDYKYSGVDSAIVLGVLHAGFPDGEFSMADDRVLSTAERIENSFRGIYTINSSSRFPGAGTAIGRYPEDKYSGQKDVHEGNPWVLNTTALAELHYRLAKRIAAYDKFTITHRNVRFFQSASGKTLAGKTISPGLVLVQGSPEMRELIRDLVARGDAFMHRVRVHANPDGSLSEQIDRNQGFMVSARDLTWSYAGFLTAFWSRP